MQNNPATYIVPTCTEPVRILQQDDELLFVSKPSGLLSVPGRNPANRDCVISRIKETHPTAQIAHRLDLDTSGLMVLALTPHARAHLGRQFEKRAVKKSYIAVVHGQLPKDQGTIDLPMIADWEKRPLQKIDFTNGKEAVTDFEVLERLPDRTRVRLKPHTGRSHQLRLHMQAIGHPILGCDFYAHDEAYQMADRLLLHAETLELFHPGSNAIIQLSDPCPF
ncbi:MAG: RNA pseudouridine synthase [Gammaproteobacteria bacterium]|nr:MAG: RNA pseudouridine synthase [Gammaproteobacteria bacterium]